MFGTTNGPVTMDDLLGAKVEEAEIIESSIIPRGDYALEFIGADQDTYTINVEDHPFEGDDASMLTFTYTIQGVDPSGKYFNAKDKRVKAEDMEELVGSEFTEVIRFGNDGLIVEGNGDNRMIRVPETEEERKKVKNSGMNKAVTLLACHLGDKQWAEGNCDSMSLGQLIEFAQGKICITPISHNTWGDNTRTQIAILDEFDPQV